MMAPQVRAWHKWLGLALGAQVVLWCVSGLYMVSLDIDFIRGLHLVRPQPSRIEPTSELAPLSAILARHPGVTGLELTHLPDSSRPLYRLSKGDERLLLDAVSGATLSPLPQSRIESLARLYYAGEGAVARVALLEEAPVEIRGRSVPVWRVDFDDALDSSFYLDPNTGALITRRHELWRVFDAFWMLHIMDYGYERDDMNNLLLRLAAAAGLVFGLTGVWLLFYSFRPRRRARRA